MIIIIAAHIPIFTLQRHEGRIFSPMAWTVTSALVGSLAFSLTLVPLACLKLLKGHIPHGDNRLVAWIKSRYEPALRKAVVRSRLVTGIAVGALAVSLVAASQLGSEFLPELNEGSIRVNLTLPPSVSAAEAQEQARAVRNALRSVPEVRTVISKVGRPDDGMDPKIFNSGEFYVDLAPESQWRAGKSKEDLIREMDDAVSALPGMEPSFSQPIRDNVLESISQVDGQIVIKVRGDDLERINATARRILERIAGVPGVARAFIDRDGTLPQYLIDIDRAGAALGEGGGVTWSGEFENQERAMKRLAWIVPLSIALIFLLLFDAFGSVKSATLIIANIPFAMVGGILALWIMRIPLSVSAAIGFIALFGQAVLNGVVMVSYFNQLRVEEGMGVEESVVKGSVVRLRTVLMTALLAMFGLLPMALSHAIGAETQRPLAVVVIGGLISATLLTLFVLPTLYCAVFARETREGLLDTSPAE